MIFTLADDPQSLAQGLADRFCLEAQAAQGRGQRLAIALSGGSTPTLFYQELGRRSADIPWAVLDIYFSDERAVPPDHPDSNFGHAHALWLRYAPPRTPIYRIPGEQGAETAAREYAHILATQLGPARGFDIVFLGLGPDGHTASLFPGMDLTAKSQVVAVPATADRSSRISLSLAALVAARTRIVLVQGAAKAKPLSQALEPSAQTPIAALWREAPVEWWLDRAAAEGLCPQILRR